MLSGRSPARDRHGGPRGDLRDHRDGRPADRGRAPRLRPSRRLLLFARLVRRALRVVPSVLWRVASHIPSWSVSTSAPTVASSAWAGMRPLATSWPPDRRTAEANGAAQLLSYTSTAATLPGS